MAEASVGDRGGSGRGGGEAAAAGLNRGGGGSSGGSSGSGGGGTSEAEDPIAIFQRLLRVIVEEYPNGFPLSNLKRRWSQLWPEHPLPTPQAYGYERGSVGSLIKTQFSATQ